MRIFIDDAEEFGIEDGQAWIKVSRCEGGVFIDKFAGLLLPPDLAAKFAAKVVEFSKPNCQLPEH